MIERMKPMRGKILVKVLKCDEKTMHGIYIPSQASESKEIIRGTTMAVGEGYIWEGKVMPLDIHTGDTVIFKYYSGFFVDPEKEYMIVDEKDILTKVEKE